MNVTCASCGAPPAEPPTGAAWKCTYCGGTTYSQSYVENYLSRHESSAHPEALRAAKVAYDSGFFENAVEKCDAALAADPHSVEAWAYKGLSLAHLVDLSNLDRLAPQIELCFGKAGEQPGDHDFVESARNVARAMVLDNLLRKARGAFEQAAKVLYAFSHEPREAQQRAQREYTKVYATCEAAFANPSHIQQMLLFVELFKKTSKAKVAPRPPPALAATVNQYLETTAAKHPELDLSQFLAGKRKTVTASAGKGKSAGSTNKLAVVVVFGLLFVGAVGSLLETPQEKSETVSGPTPSSQPPGPAPRSASAAPTSARPSDGVDASAHDRAASKRARVRPMAREAKGDQDVRLTGRERTICREVMDAYYEEDPTGDDNSAEARVKKRYAKRLGMTVRALDKIMVRCLAAESQGQDPFH